MMNFRVATAALIAILGDAAVGRYRVAGYQPDRQHADELEGMNRLVTVFFQQSGFAKQGSTLNGPTQNNITVGIILQVASAVSVDVLTLEDPESSDAERMAALAGAQDSAYLCDQSFDELSDIVYQIIMNATNKGFGLPKGTVVNRFIESITKDEPIRQTGSDGELFLLNGVIQLTCRVEEIVLGDETNIPNLSVDIVNQATADIVTGVEDTHTKTGVEVDPSNP